MILGKNNKERKILNKLNFDVKDGEFALIVGENGAGKSTLFDAISGSIQVNSGKIWLSGQDITHTLQKHRAKLVSKVMQDPKLGTMENMTILENMAFAFKRGQIRGGEFFSSKHRIRTFKEKLSMLNIGLEDKIQELVSNLSGGQRQALSILMAILKESKILLLDEITAALDPASTDSVMELTNQILREKKLTCIMITHNLSQAIKYGDSLWFLKNGVFIKKYDKETKSKMTLAELSSKFEEV
ncbi:MULTISPECIES: ABC transporter ATP-binding protein [Holospora]|uniref:ABC transporter ATP-binding protein n=1 Tax=Holospora TaxID=44747 RepID=UPI0019D3A4A9|nr:MULTISPECIES: ATP-binding cassette domain-containing protein [Holospora]